MDRLLTRSDDAPSCDKFDRRRTWNVMKSDLWKKIEYPTSKAEIFCRRPAFWSHIACFLRLSVKSFWFVTPAIKNAFLVPRAISVKIMHFLRLPSEPNFERKNEYASILVLRARNQSTGDFLLKQNVWAKSWTPFENDAGFSIVLIDNGRTSKITILR